MKPHALDRKLRRRARHSRSGFSLAELMIALAILAMGLLVIGAALPLGIRYTRETVNMAEGQAAVDHGLDLLAQNLVLHRTVLDHNDNPIRVPVIFQPRDANGRLIDAKGNPVAAGEWAPREGWWEPLLKVRPIFVHSIRGGLGGGNPGDEYRPYSNNFLCNEIAARWWLQSVGLTPSPSSQWLREVDFQGWMGAALPCVATVFPPVPADPWPANAALTTSWNTNIYQRRPVLATSSSGSWPAGAETRKALDERRIVYTALYRRVSYARGADPTLYEVVVVAARLPSQESRFLHQAPQNAGTNMNTNYLSDGGSVAPTPWLVTFQQLPVPPSSFYEGASRAPRDALANNPPPELKFIASRAIGDLIPPGSLLIPAVNDRNPTSLDASPGTEIQLAGFVPHAPDVLPIYEVTRRELTAGNRWEIVVRNNRFYPWINEAEGATNLNWPVWIIPPAVTEFRNNSPVYPDTSPIVAWGRRVVPLREVP
ncbi:MAG: prepilin-type N-terminal cleavage/methylation domain-containing protein [Phycisphaerales bacterium]|nr:prepilin-type N-terminal cleavage/methylation domain-containing protein [Phycisphaerales bacterium]